MKKDLWFSLYSRSKPYTLEAEPYYDPTQFAWTSAFSSLLPEIEKELTIFLEKKNFLGYFNTAMVEQVNTWKTIPIKTWTINHVKNQAHFPSVVQLIQKYPELTSISFSLLEPHGKIKRHHGDTNGIFRCHLGIEIPAQLPGCGFEVSGVQTSWEKGKWLIFLDAHQHSAWNNTDQQRIIMIVDVVRPEFATKKNYIASTVLMALFLQRLPKLIRFFLAPFGFILRLFVLFGIRLSNLLRLF